MHHKSILRYLHDEVLHPEHLALGVRVVGDVDELRHVRRVDLLELAGDEHGGGADELQLGPLHRHQGEEAVDEVDRQVQRLRLQLVLLGHLGRKNYNKYFK